MAIEKIRDLFASNIERRIEEVIKVDQSDESIVAEELAEYVLTDSIRTQMTNILEHYWETPKKPHEGIAVWVSGFFGSGKSSFAKYVGLGLANRTIQGRGAGERLAQRAGDPKIQVLLTSIAEQVPTHAVIFDVSTDRGIRSGNQSITEILYRQLLQSLGYARDLDLAELEITLEEGRRLEAFKDTFQRIFGKDWDGAKGLIAIAVQQASRAMHELEPDTYMTVDSWREAAKGRADITPGLLAERALELLARRARGRTLLFVVDEVGQFVARDVQKMLDLQGVVQSFGRVGRGRLWIMVTSQEKLTELVGGLDDKRVELARLMDRFPLQVHLEPADISEVTSKRVLAKNAAAEKALRELFSQHRGRLTDTTRLTADIKLQELDTESFVELYPLLPYQVDLIINVVSGLRMQGGASKHVGGANRTIIKLAQQLLVHPEVDLANAAVGTLARIDQIYDLVSGNIASEIRGKIDDIARKVPHPLAQPVAKAICLLQYVRSIHRTAENIAASLHPGVDADSRLTEVKAALEALTHAHMVRLGDDGYRIPSPAEDDWERQRASLSPKPGDVHRLHAEVVTGLWQPAPQHVLHGVRAFKAGLTLGGRPADEGDITLHLGLAEAGSAFEQEIEEFRRRSQSERQAIFWMAALHERIDRETVEVFRSKEMLSRKERGAQTKDETALVAEERRRLRRHQDELRRLLKEALLSGTIFFRGNDRSPDDTTSEVGAAAAKVLSQALPEVFERFEEAAARVGKKDLDALLTAENLRGLTPVFSQLQLLQEQGGKTVFRTDHGPLAELLSKISNRASYGEVATGRYLTEEFGKAPFGWDFDVVRLMVVALVRAGQVEATSKGVVIDSAVSIEAQNTFTNNNVFRQASFSPKRGLDYKQLVEAGEAYKEVFGKEIAEIEQSVVANAIGEAAGRHEGPLSEVHTRLVVNQLPGADVLQQALSQVRLIRGSREEAAILTFNGAYKIIKEGIRRAKELSQALTEPAVQDLKRARVVLDSLWPFLQTEPDLEDSETAAAARLADLMGRETFFRELAAIDQEARVLEGAYEKRFAAARAAQTHAYQTAIEQLHGLAAWVSLSDEQRVRVEGPLRSRVAVPDSPRPSIPLMRSEVTACEGRLRHAIEEMLRLIDGSRLARVSVAGYFSDGIETEEQLNQALEGLRQECLELIAAGKKVLIQ